MNWQQQVERRLAALEHRAAAALRIGVVSAVRAEPRYGVRVRLGPAAVTDWLPVWAPARSVWTPLEVDDPVPVMSIGGDETLHFALGGIVAARVGDPEAKPEPPGAADLAAVQLSATEDSWLRLEERKVRLQLGRDCYVELENGGARIAGDLTVVGSLMIQGAGVTHQGTNIGRTHRHRGKPPTLLSDYTLGPE